MTNLIENKKCHPSSISRRTLLKGLAALALSPLLTSCGETPTPLEIKKHFPSVNPLDVINPETNKPFTEEEIEFLAQTKYGKIINEKDSFAYDSFNGKMNGEYNKSYGDNLFIPIDKQLRVLNKKTGKTWLEAEFGTIFPSGYMAQESISGLLINDKRLFIATSQKGWWTEYTRPDQLSGYNCGCMGINSQFYTFRIYCLDISK